MVGNFADYNSKRKDCPVEYLIIFVIALSPIGAMVIVGLLTESHKAPIVALVATTCLIGMGGTIYLTYLFAKLGNAFAEAIQVTPTP